MRTDTIAAIATGMSNSGIGIVRISGDEAFMAETAFALRLFSFTYLTRWFSFATQSYMLAIERAAAASVISVSTALVFPVLLVAVLWPMGLTGLWLNFAGTSLLAGGLAAVVLFRFFTRMPKNDLEARSTGMDAAEEC